MLETVAAVVIGVFIYDRLEGVYYDVRYWIRKRMGKVVYEDFGTLNDDIEQENTTK